GAYEKPPAMPEDIFFFLGCRLSPSRYYVECSGVGVYYFFLLMLLLIVMVCLFDLFQIFMDCLFCNL
ncbi:hypothetical protein LDJ79_16620, partial [Vibrio tritonius]